MFILVCNKGKMSEQRTLSLNSISCPTTLRAKASRGSKMLLFNWVKVFSSGFNKKTGQSKHTVQVIVFMNLFSAGVLMAVFENCIAGRVTVYSVPGCSQCSQAKTALQALNLPVCEVDVSHDAAVRAWLEKITGSSTVPQIFFNHVHLGGNDSLQNMVGEH